MFQYDSKSNEQPDKTKTNTTAANKNNVQAKTQMPVQEMSLFSFSHNLENSGKQNEEQNQLEPASIKPDNTGIPLQIKNNFENLSGFSFDDVRVHYNSDKPAQLQALAYTQGTQVYIGPGQEKYLGHELGHVVQQMGGRVRATGRLGGLPVNDNASLEREASHIGTTIGVSFQHALSNSTLSGYAPLQFAKFSHYKLNVAGERHDESDDQRTDEKAFTTERTGSNNYWQESTFRFDMRPLAQQDQNPLSEEKKPFADPWNLRVLYDIRLITDYMDIFDISPLKQTDKIIAARQDMAEYVTSLLLKIIRVGTSKDGFELTPEKKKSAKSLEAQARLLYDAAQEYNSLGKLKGQDESKKTVFGKSYLKLSTALRSFIDAYRHSTVATPIPATRIPLSWARSEAMHQAATMQIGLKGVWKIGDRHREEIATEYQHIQYNLLSREEFQHEFKIWKEKDSDKLTDDFDM